MNDKITEEVDIHYKSGDKLIALINELCDKHNITPKDFFVKAYTSYSYGDDFPEACLCYTRLKTEEEVAAEQREKIKIEKHMLAQKREQLERLKKELGEI